MSEIFEVERAEVKINNIWASYIETAKRTSYVTSILKRDTKFKFLLLHPSNKEAIEKRAAALVGYTPSDIIKKIEENIFEIVRIYQAVYDETLKELKLIFNCAYIQILCQLHLLRYMKKFG